MSTRYCLVTITKKNRSQKYFKLNEIFFAFKQSFLDKHFNCLEKTKKTEFSLKSESIKLKTLGDTINTYNIPIKYQSKLFKKCQFSKCVF